MTQYAETVRVLLIGGSLRSGSVNTAALQTAQDVAPEGIETLLFDRMGELPLFNLDNDRDPLPEPVVFLRDSLARADSFFLSTPEFAGSMPGAFKNLLDWSVGGTGLLGKPIGWINPSSHGGSKRTYEHLAIVLGYVGGEVLEQACLSFPIARQALDSDGLVPDPALRGSLGAALAALAGQVRRTRSDRVA